ncbi:MAG: AbrB/MazE/SpoVT family DNA-binding domain-containing protein [Clostridia bacterium]|jgi:AbrB family looped-hinge helix DNA binding protein|nr:AbrB/MazE/SpoVT family DNA-binding domain-containing protein [Clostridia bacterium]
MSLAKISEKGQLTLPREIRQKYNMNKASYVRIIALEDGVKLVPTNQGGISSLRGIVKVDEKQDFKAIRHQVMEDRHREDR